MNFNDSAIIENPQWVKWIHTVEIYYQFFSWSHHESTICFVKWSWIHNQLCKFTVDQRFILRIHLESTYNFAHWLRIHFLFYLLFCELIHYESTIRLQIHYEFTIFSVNSLWIDYLLCEWTMSPLFLLEFTMKSLCNLRIHYGPEPCGSGPPCESVMTTHYHIHHTLCALRQSRDPI